MIVPFRTPAPAHQQRPSINFEARLKRILILGILGFGLFAFLLGRLAWPDFGTRWRSLRDGMNQAEVREALGPPNWIGNTECEGAGGKMVTRWRYGCRHLGRQVYYCVDFDYIGAGGAPAVFRTERFWREWEWPSWWPWRRAYAM